MAARSVLITGGSGFVGSNLADHVIAAGHKVTIFDDLSRTGSEVNLGWLRDRHGVTGFSFVRGDIRRPEQVEAAANGAQVIYHVAAQTAVTTSVTNPREDFEINALGTFNTLEAARRYGDDPIFIVTSTNKVYGGMDDVVVTETETSYRFRDFPNGIDESRPLDFHSPYGCSKGTADQYVRDYARIYGLRSVVFRMSAIYGPHQWGMEDQAWVAWFVMQALKDRPITIYGDGKQARDVLFIDDLVRAFELATNHIDVTAGEVYNLGGGAQNTISIWAEFQPLLREALGRDPRAPAFADWRPGDQRIYVSDTSKAKCDFGWQPEIGVRGGVQRLVAWATENEAHF